MTAKKTYQTRQKQEICACLQQNQGSHMTVEMIADQLRKNGIQVGQTTIYRNLSKLIQDGQIIKYADTKGMRASFQYVGNPQEHASHYHLVCLHCGHMVHLQCGIVDAFSSHIETEHDFLLDCMKTVFYGYCTVCRQHCPPAG